MVTIATFNDATKARQLKRRFQDAGLRADVHNEAPLQQVGFMSRPQANAKVMVEDTDFESAQNLMVEWEATDPDISAALVRCPQCSSSNIEYPQMTRKFMTPALVGVLNFRVICGYSIFEELHWGQRTRAAEISGSVASHSTMRFWALSKSVSSTITLAFACGRDMKPTCCKGASL